MENKNPDSGHLLSTGPVFNASVFLVLLLACLNFTGIIFDVGLLRSLVPDTSVMKGVSSFSFILLGTAFILKRKERKSSRMNFLAMILSSLVLITSALSIFVNGYFLVQESDPSIAGAFPFNMILLPESRMNLVTAILFMILSAAFMLRSSTSQFRKNVINVLVLSVIFLSYLMITSHILQVHIIHSTGTYQIAASTSLGFIALSVSLLCFDPETWIMRVFLGRDLGSISLRRILPAVLFLPLLIGWIRIWTERLGWISSEVGVVFVAYTYSVCLVLIAWLVAKSLNRIDRIQKSIRESERISQQRLKFHFENSPLGIVEWDSDFVVTRWSDEAEHLFGWNRTETIGMRIDSLNMIFPDDIPIVDKTMKRLLKGKERHVVSTNRNLTKSGDIRTCTWYNSVLTNEKGEMTSVMSLILDITDRIRAEDNLRHLNEELEMIVQDRTSKLSKTMSDLAIERERFKVVLDRLPVFVMLIDADYRIVFSNKRFAETFGEAQRKRCHELLFGRTGRCETCGASEVFSRSSPCNWEWTGPDQRIYHVSDFPFTDVDGSRLVLEVGLDITEEKNIEKLILGKVIEAEENNRKILSRDLHDDLGPILSTIKLQLGMIYRSESEMKIKEITGSCEDLLSEAIEKIRMLANNLMPGVLEKFGLEAAVGSFIKKIGGENQFQIEFHSELDDARFDMDSELHVYRMITELITNTMRHSAADFARLSIRHEEEMLEILYSDNGKGYMPVKIPSVNSGMGLQNISNRVNLLNGKIEFYDIRGKTEVRISIPQKISK